MKTLQKNYTTPEQSKRLLELGLPSDSADCYYDQYQILNFRTELDYGYDFFELNFRFIPCWSVGRLIEIYHICVSPGCSFTFHVCFPNLMNEIIYKLAEANSNGWLNLSRLEE